MVHPIHSLPTVQENPESGNRGERNMSMTQSEIFCPGTRLAVAGSAASAPIPNGMADFIKLRCQPVEDKGRIDHGIE